MNSVRLHRQFVQQMLDLGLRATAPQRENLAWLCQSLAYSPDCHLATLALHIPLQGRRESLIERERRYLKNAHVQVARCYEPWLRNLLTHWPSCECCLVMDPTDIEHDASILLLGAAYRKRLLPLVWQVLPFGASGAEAQVALLRYIQPFLPPVRTCFYADSEFRSVKVQDVCRQSRLALAGGSEERPLLPALTTPGSPCVLWSDRSVSVGTYRACSSIRDSPLVPSI